MTDQNLQAAKHLFQETKRSLEDKKTIPWSLTIDVLKAAHILYETFEAKQFLDEYFIKIVNLTMQQSPAKFGQFEKSSFEEIQVWSLKVLLRVLPGEPKFLTALARIFDQTIPFYSGCKTGYSFSPGWPNTRMHNVRQFEKAKGFKVVAEAMKNPSFHWLGADVFLILLKAMSITEVQANIDEKTKKEIVSSIMASLIALPDEQVKKESTESLHGLIRMIGSFQTQISKLQFPLNMESFYGFWIESTVKFMRSSSLVLRLFAWDMLNELIQEAKVSRPSASSYRIERAGTEFVNGIYNLVPRPDHMSHDAVNYTKIVTGVPGVTVLTLFRCTMRNTKAKWWFVSQADLEKPGTDKDIDYYLHKSRHDEEREPSIRGWTRVNPGIDLKGMDPSPILHRNALHLPKGITKDMYLDHKLLEYIRKSDLIDTVFGPSIHREIVSRCGRFLLILAEYEGLKSEDLKTIWKAAMHSTDHDIQEEVFAQLIPLSTYLSDALFSELIALAQEMLRQDEDKSANVAKVALFLERFAQDNFKHINGVLSDSAMSNLLSLVWELYQSLGFETLRNGAAIEELLTVCFNQKGGSGKVLEHIRECVAELRAYSVINASSASPVDELKASRIIQTLQYLISKHMNGDIATSLVVSDFPHCILDEIVRFTLANRPPLPTTASTTTITTTPSTTSAIPSATTIPTTTATSTPLLDDKIFSALLANKLHVLRKFYQCTKNPQVCIPLHVVDKLWTLLSQRPVELEEFFTFVKGPSAKCSSGSNQNVDAVFDKQDSLKIFVNYLCSDSVDWAYCGDGAFECFHDYFSQMDSLDAGGDHFSNAIAANVSSSTNSSSSSSMGGSSSSSSSSSSGGSSSGSHIIGGSSFRRLSLDTLWRVALDIGTPISSNKSVELLLQAYEAMAYHEGMEQTSLSLLEIVFNHLEAFQSVSTKEIDGGKGGQLGQGEGRGGGSGSNGGLSWYKRKQLRAKRCLLVLYSFLNSSKNQGTEPIHAVRSSIAQFDLSVHYRRITSYYNQSTQVDVNRVETGSEGSITLRVHPYNTYAQLRTMICTAVDIPEAQAHMVVDGRLATLAHDSARLIDLGLHQSKEMSISYRVSYSACRVLEDEMSQTSHGDRVRGIQGKDIVIPSAPSSMVTESATLGSLLAANRKQFDCLLDMCQEAANTDEEICKNCWEIMKMIPTQLDLNRTIQKLCSVPEQSPTNATTTATATTAATETANANATAPSPSSTYSPWSSCLSSLSNIHSDSQGISNGAYCSLARATYTLQVVHHNLEPVCNPLGAQVIQRDGRDVAVVGIVEDGVEDSRGQSSAYGVAIASQGRETAPSKALSCVERFVETEGFSAVLAVLISIPREENLVNAEALAVTLQIIHFVLHTIEAAALQPPSDKTSAAADLVARLNVEIKDNSSKIIGKLIFAARNAAAKGESNVVGNALAIITLLIKDPVIASELTTKNSAQAQSLLFATLRSGSKVVRDVAANFAVEVGRSQAEVFGWLVDDLERIEPSDEYCVEFFGALSKLLLAVYSQSLSSPTTTTSGGSSGSTSSSILSSFFGVGSGSSGSSNSKGSDTSSSDLTKLANLLSSKLMGYPKDKQPHQEERYTLAGYLEVVRILLETHPQSVLSTSFGSNLTRILLTDFLFPLAGSPSAKDSLQSDQWEERHPICDRPSCRIAAFQVLTAYLRISTRGYEEVLSELSRMCKLAGRFMNGHWGIQVSHDVKRNDLVFSGLKNQGCTCYMNSLLQQLFMNPTFREAIMCTPLKEAHRNTLWHKSDEELVNQRVLFEQFNGSWRVAHLQDFDIETSTHTVIYESLDGTPNEVCKFNIHSGRYHRETGRLKLIQDTVYGVDDEEVEEEALAEREESAYRVLEQLQRVFCFMKLSKKRYFDPRPFIEACKTLNLNFNVYHQNDAAEFFDQLLDRIETATKGKHTQVDVWKSHILQSVFGGQYVSQKVPQDCSLYKADKAGCGHWQGSREESFLKVEFVVRGKESVDESLEELVQGELMDGDNKVNCEVCMEKKVTTRRTCIGHLPQSLILHLRRFDLDYTTFDTVKLNNRMAFPTVLNMFKYTKEGIAAEERESERNAKEEGKEQQQPDGTRKQKLSQLSQLEYDTSIDSDAASSPSDFEYELHGVLVHAGVAQGGHYYSFVKDSSAPSSSSPPSPSSFSTSSEHEDSSDVADTAGRWYRFDDEDVSPFDPHNIPSQCYGGPMSAHTGQPLPVGGKDHNTDEDRTANALMLFYRKKEPQPDTSTNSNSDSNSSTIGNSSNNSSSSSISSSSGSSTRCSPSTSTAALPNLVQAAKKRDPSLIDGMEAFQREVRESNLQHTLSLYLIDPDMQNFVRGLVDAASYATSTSTSTKKQVKDDAKDGQDRGVSEVEKEAIALQTAAFNCSFLLDVVLHCRERGAVRASVHSMRGLFETHPHTASWFIRRILDDCMHTMEAESSLTASAASSPTSSPSRRKNGRPGPSPHTAPVCAWLSEFLLTSTDALARGTFVQLLVQAVQAVAPLDPNTFSYITSTDLPLVLDQLVDEERAIACGSGKPLSCTTLLSALVLQIRELVFEAVGHIRTSDELLVLIRDLSAAVPSMCVAFQASQLVSILCYFVMPELSRSTVRIQFEQCRQDALGNSKQQGNRLDYSNLLQSVFEALAALLGVPQLRKVNLLEDRSCLESDLVPVAKEAISTIFSEVSRGGGMDHSDITTYFERVSGGGQKMTSLQVRNILDRFHTLSDGRLSLDGFLQYYTDTASYNPKSVWRDLHIFSFRNDLSREAANLTGRSHRRSGRTRSGSNASSGSSSGYSSPSRASVGNDTSRDSGSSSGSSSDSDEPAPLLISPDCHQCLINITFYEVGMAASEASTVAIARRVCLKDAHTSRLLIQQALHKLHVTASDNTWNSKAIGIMNDFLHLMLSLDDDLQLMRVTEVLLCQTYGLAVVAVNESSRASNCRANEYHHTALFDRFIMFVQDLLTVPGVAQVINELSLTEPKVKAVKGYLRMTPGYALTENEDFSVRNTVIRLEGAGIPEVNGDYTFKSVMQNAGYYSRKGEFEKKDVTFTVYKCSLSNGGHQWFISITPEEYEPGTKNDTDFYWSTAKLEKLPPNAWQKLSNPHCRDPPPKVSYIQTNDDGDMLIATSIMSDMVPSTSPLMTAVSASPLSHQQSQFADSSDSDKDSSMMVDDLNDDSFMSGTSDYRDFYE